LNSPSLLAGRSPSSCPQTLAYPSPTAFPLPEYATARNAFTKFEPRRLGFHFFAQIAGPCLPADLHLPTFEPQCTPPQLCSHCPKYTTPRNVFVNIKPRPRFPFFLPNSPPSRASRSVSPCPQTPTYPTPTGLPHSNWIPAAQIHHHHPAMHSRKLSPGGSNTYLHPSFSL
jgi:hypothetical protein